jgi:fatty acid desaturase
MSDSSKRSHQLSEAKIDKGYRPNDRAKAVVKEASKPDLLTSILTLLGNHMAMVLIAALGCWAWVALPIYAAVPLIAIGMLLTTRFQRGLECMVHEGSHYNFVRGKGRPGKVLNDAIANLLAAFPTFVTVGSFRASHWLHHEHFGDEDDPDLIRYNRLRIEYMDRAKRGDFIAGMIARLLPYVAGWWMALGFSPLTILAGLAWHGLVWILPLSILFGLGTAFAIWAAFWFIPFVFILPFTRFLAESGKHQYLDNGTVFTATVSNIGPIHTCFLHPHGDGYHLLHHLFPCIPHHQMAKAHTLLVAYDDNYRARHKHRTVIFQNPIVGESA